MSRAPVVALKNISKSFAGVSVLQDINCSFERGKVHCLLGENGAGKSTLVKIIAGAYRADRGRIEIDGVAHDGYAPLWARSNGINTIYQEIDLVPNLTVWENIVMGAEPRNALGFIKPRKALARTSAILGEMGVSIDPNTVVQSLSLAQQQMVAIAKALAVDTSLIILDEPTAVFTRRETEALFRLVRKLTAEDKAIVFISHHLDEVFEIGDWITVLRDGKLVSSGSITDYTYDRLVSDMVGRNFDPHSRSETPERGALAVKARDLSDGEDVHNVNFDLHNGEILCLAGLVGAGRSETAKLLVGASKPVSGTIELAGRDFKPKSPADALQNGIAYLPEDRKSLGLALDRPAEDNMWISLIQIISHLGPSAWKKVRKSASDHLGLLDIDPPVLTKAARFFSGGNQQKLILGRIMMVDPNVLILDEPTRGVDVGARSKIYETIRNFRDTGKAVLVISSDLEEVLSISDRIIVMNKGRVIGELSADEATEEKVMHLAFSTGGAETAIQ